MSWVAQGFRLVLPPLLGLSITSNLVALLGERERLNFIKNKEWGKNKLKNAVSNLSPVSMSCLGSNLLWISFSFQSVQSSPAKTSSQLPCQVPANTPQQPTQLQPRGPSQSKVAHCLLTFLSWFCLPAARVCTHRQWVQTYHVSVGVVCGLKMRGRSGQP